MTSSTLFDLPVRFREKVYLTDTCWVWMGAKVKATSPYGRAWANGRDTVAHRAVYELLRGPIPEGLTLDHLCRNRSCVNPEHLEPVTHAENIRRGNGGLYNRLKTHCLRGHEFTPENTKISLRKGGSSRKCRACARLAAAALAADQAGSSE